MSKILIDFYNKPARFTYEAYRSLKVKNNGGDSVISEMYSIDKLQTDLKLHRSKCILEREVKYCVKSNMLDYILSSNYKKIGVSVTRCIPVDFFDFHKANKFLVKKIIAFDIAEKCLDKKYKCNNKILHIWCRNLKHAKLLKEVGNTISWNGKIWITVCNLSEIYDKTR